MCPVLSSSLSLGHFSRKFRSDSFFVQRDTVQELISLFFANIAIAMCELLDKGDCTFEELRDACVPWATMFADRLNSAYAYLLLSLLRCSIWSPSNQPRRSISSRVVLSLAKRCIRRPPTWPVITPQAMEQKQPRFDEMRKVVTFTVAFLRVCPFQFESIMITSLPSSASSVATTPSL